MKKAYCTACSKRLLNDDVALSLKMLGKGTAQLLCRECLAQRIGCEASVLTIKAEQLKAVGCEFFARTYISEE